MIQFKHHLEVLKHSEDIESWIGSMKEEEAVIWAVRIQSSYPLSSPIKPKGLFEKIDIEDMLFGQFIMVEMFLNAEMDFNDKMKSIIPLILRPSEGDFDNDDPETEKTLMETIMMCDAAYIEDLFKRFLSNRDDIIHKKYEGAIYKSPESSLDEDKEYGTVVDNESKFNSEWFYYVTARSFVNEDLTRLQEAYELKMRVVLPEISYRTKKNNLEITRQKMERIANSFKK